MSINAFGGPTIPASDRVAPPVAPPPAAAPTETPAAKEAPVGDQLQTSGKASDDDPTADFGAGALPGDQEFDNLVNSKLGDGTALPNAAVEQYGPHSCGAATLQETWAEQDPQGYQAACDQLQATGSFQLPGGQMAGLGAANQQWLADFAAKQQPPLTATQQADMAMQAALMEHATNGSYRIADDVAGSFGGLQEGQLVKLASAVCPGMTMVTMGGAREAASMANNTEGAHTSAHDQSLIELHDALNSGQPALVRINAADGSSHVVRIQAVAGDMVAVSDANGSKLVSRSEIAHELTIGGSNAGTDGESGTTSSGTRWRR